jgi:transcriptional regulator with XRE-family HTH domain
MYDENIIVDRLLKVMKKLDLSQAKISNDTGMKPSIISRYCTKKTPVSLEFIVRFSREYNISCDYLVGNSDHWFTLDSLFEKHNGSQKINLETKEGQDLLVQILIREKIFPTSKVYLALLDQILSNLREYITNDINIK